MSDREMFEANPPPQFLALSTADQTSKLKRRREIESNWERDIRGCIPPELQPRQSAGSTKPRIGEAGATKLWWQWSVEFTTKVARISFMTTRDLPFAQDLLMLEVKERQRGTSAKSREAEVGLKDLDRIIEALSKARETATRTSPADSYEGMQDFDGNGETETRPYKRDETGYSGEADVTVTTEALDENTPSNPFKRQKTFKSSNTPAKIATLRGKAMRCEQEASKLQAEAARFKAEAYELESSWILQNTE